MLIKHLLADGKVIEIEVPENAGKLKVEHERQDEKKPLSEIAIRFTGWLEIVVKRAKIDYIRHQKKQKAEISIEELIDREKLKYNFQSIESKVEFDFENVLIADAFSKLPPKRRQVLIMLFVKNMTPEEIAEVLDCSVQHVYNQRSLALKKLKLLLKKGE